MISVLHSDPNTTHRCVHGSCPGSDGLCLITIGNSLRGDDGVASALCDAIPAEVLSQVCRFDLGTQTGYLADCIKGHDSAIILDCTKNGGEPGTVTILDLISVLDRYSRSNSIKSTHSLSFLEELLLVKRQGDLPKTLVLFGIEAGDVEWSCAISPELKEKMPTLAIRLSLLVSVIRKIHKKDA